jgi:hypothetical protein
MGEAELEEVAAELASLAERLSDLAMERLRAAADGDRAEVDAAVAVERRINRARRSVERAVEILSPPNG